MTRDCLGEFVCKTVGDTSRCHCEVNYGVAFFVLLILVAVFAFMFWLEGR